MNRRQHTSGLILAFFTLFSLVLSGKPASAQKATLQKTLATKVMKHSVHPKNRKAGTAKPAKVKAASSKTKVTPAHVSRFGKRAAVRTGSPQQLGKKPHAAGHKAVKPLKKGAAKDYKSMPVARPGKPNFKKAAQKVVTQAAKSKRAAQKPHMKPIKAPRPARPSKLPNRPATKANHSQQATAKAKKKPVTPAARSQPVARKLQVHRQATAPATAHRPARSVAPVAAEPRLVRSKPLVKRPVQVRKIKSAPPSPVSVAPLARRSPSPEPLALDRATAYSWRSEEDRWFESPALPASESQNPQLGQDFDGVGRPRRFATPTSAPTSPEKPVVKETPGVTYIAEGGTVVDNSHAMRPPLSAHERQLVRKPQMSGRSLPPEAAEALNEESYGVGRKIVAIAQRFLGLPYVYGAASPRVGFDCSGLVMYVFQQLRINLPHRADLQFNYGHNVDKQNLKPGDLVFFRELGGSDIGHVGIYVGNQTFIHASTTGRPIKYDSLMAPNYVRRYMGAKRLASR